ncbi:hypothetical protein SJDPG2_00010 [Porphyromonas gingivalis SJD2]|nr:hypothetical protein SJDPG2_00010 [Porphyromonas gingivalis SJD2]
MYINRRLEKAFSDADIKEAPAEFSVELRRVRQVRRSLSYAMMLSVDL